MGDRKVVRVDWKGVTEHQEILPIQNTLLVFGQIVETQEAGPRGDRFLVNWRCGAFNPCRIMMEPH